MMVYLQMIEGGHNRQRFALLYDTYKGLMFRVARRLLHSDADALAALAPQYREVLLLRYYNGYSARELAAYFEVSHAAMKKMLTRAKAALRAKLEEGEVPYDDGYSVR